MTAAPSPEQLQIAHALRDQLTDLTADASVVSSVQKTALAIGPIWDAERLTHKQALASLAMLTGVMLHSIFTETETNLDDHTFRIGFLQAADRGFLAAALAAENRRNSSNKDAAE